MISLLMVIYYNEHNQCIIYHKSRNGIGKVTSGVISDFLSDIPLEVYIFVFIQGPQLDELGVFRGPSSVLRPYHCFVIYIYHVYVHGWNKVLSYLRMYMHFYGDIHWEYCALSSVVTNNLVICTYVDINWCIKKLSNM